MEGIPDHLSGRSFTGLEGGLGGSQGPRMRRSEGEATGVSEVGMHGIVAGRKRPLGEMR